MYEVELRVSKLQSESVLTRIRAALPFLFGEADEDAAARISSWGTPGAGLPREEGGRPGTVAADGQIYGGPDRVGKSYFAGGGGVEGKEGEEEETGGEEGRGGGRVGGGGGGGGVGFPYSSWASMPSGARSRGSGNMWRPRQMGSRQQRWTTPSPDQGRRIPQNISRPDLGASSQLRF